MGWGVYVEESSGAGWERSLISPGGGDAVRMKWRSQRSSLESRLLIYATVEGCKAEELEVGQRETRQGHGSSA